MAKDEWRARLTAIPERVREDDRVTLTVTLSLGNRDIPPQLYQFFQFWFDADDPRLNQYIQDNVNKHMVTPPHPNEAIIEHVPRCRMAATSSE